MNTKKIGMNKREGVALLRQLLCYFFEKLHYKVKDSFSATKILYIISLEPLLENKRVIPNVII